MQIPAELEIAKRLPSPGCSIADAERYTRWLATHHYENFNVVSILLPRHLRQHFYNLYAYCRWADDLADEVSDPALALELIDSWERELRACYAGNPTHPVFVALRGTIESFDIPSEPFADLLSAFRQDQTVHRYPTWDGVLDYCRFSANPVGRLVLYICGYRDSARQELSDATCTALQLANFWQDVSRDLEKGRIYIPSEALAARGLTEEDITARRFDGRYTSLMKELIATTRELFARGLPLVESVDPALAVDIDLFSRGGLAILDSIESGGYNTLQSRPSISKANQLQLLIRAMGKRILARRGLPHNISLHSDGPKLVASVRLRGGAGHAGNVSLAEVAQSYQECRRVAREAASNFYYAFFMLPQAKRDALCALYAFMRSVDDVSDAAGGIADKQRGIARWRASLDAAVSGNVNAHAILPAFADTLQRYQIPPRYFHDLISGAEMDLSVSEYGTFERLREYCYRVAGTVGLTCLHVFGFDDPRAPELAEKLGIAFQLTNIIRDVSADYGMRRVYLPQDDLQKFGVRPSDLGRGPLTPAVASLLEFECARARDFYHEGVQLIPRVHEDSRAALWALVRIYSGLLRHIEERGYDVFSGRVRLSTPEKAGILLRARFGWYSQHNVIEERDRDRRGPGGTVRGRRAS